MPLQYHAVNNIHAGAKWHIDDLVQVKRDDDGVVRVYNIDVREVTTAGDEAEFEGREFYWGDLLDRVHHG